MIANLRSSMMGWMPVNGRICEIRLKGISHNTCSGYEYIPDQEDTFCEQLEKASMPRQASKKPFEVYFWNVRLISFAIGRDIFTTALVSSTSSDIKAPGAYELDKSTKSTMDSVNPGIQYRAKDEKPQNSRCFNIEALKSSWDIQMYMSADFAVKASQKLKTHTAHLVTFFAKTTMVLLLKMLELNVVRSLNSLQHQENFQARQSIDS